MLKLIYTKIMIFSRKTIHLLQLGLFISILGATICSSKAAEVVTRLSREEYISRYKDIAIDHHIKYGIPASITMAQGILESDSGNSILAKGSNNHFGIKCKSYWTGRTFTHTDDAPDECFRAYDSVEESYIDHAEFLDTSPRYDSLFLHQATDYRSWARGLKAAGYATAPDYATRLVKLIEDNQLYLLDSEAEDGVKAYDAMLAAKRSGHKIEPSTDNESITSSSIAKINPNNYKVSISTHNGYNVYKNNQTMHIIANDGDTQESIALCFGVSTKRLAKYNDWARDREIPISQYQIVYVERKQNRWFGDIKEHTVASGETLQSISQEYGIRENSLRKLNKLKSGAVLTEGETITLRE